MGSAASRPTLREDDPRNYGRPVANVPRNAASDRIFEGLATWRDPETMVAAWEEHHSDDFVRVDRRRLVASPNADRATHLEGQLMWFEFGDGQPVFGAEILAARGDRLALVRASVGYANRQGREALSVVTYDARVEKTIRHVHFDLDGQEAALAELDRQHTQIEAGEEPTDPR